MLDCTSNKTITIKSWGNALTFCAFTLLSNIDFDIASNISRIVHLPETMCRHRIMFKDNLFVYPIISVFGPAMISRVALDVCNKRSSQLTCLLSRSLAIDDTLSVPE